MKISFTTIGSSFLLALMYIMLASASITEAQAESNCVYRPDGNRTAAASTPTQAVCVPELAMPGEYDWLPQRRLDNERVETKWTFGWRACPGARRYHLFVIGPGALNPIIDNDSITSATYQNTAYHYGITQREGWTWKVRAFVDGRWGDWSEERTFNVAAPEYGNVVGPIGPDPGRNTGIVPENPGRAQSAYDYQGFWVNVAPNHLFIQFVQIIPYSPNRLQISTWLSCHPTPGEGGDFRDCQKLGPVEVYLSSFEEVSWKQFGKIDRPGSRDHRGGQLTMEFNNVMTLRKGIPRYDDILKVVSETNHGRKIFHDFKRCQFIGGHYKC